MKLKITILAVSFAIVFGVALAVGINLVAKNGATTQQPVSTPTPVVQVTPTPELQPLPTPDGRTAVLMFGGDVMLGRTLQDRMEVRGATWPFANIAKTMAAADLTVVNLESPFRKDFRKTPIDSLVLRGDPQGIEGLRLAGVDVVSLANNHITDMGLQGLTDTLDILGSAAIAQTGAGTNRQRAETPHIQTVQGIRFGFVSATYGVNFTTSGVFFNQASPAWVTEQISKLVKEVDIAVLLCHCGNEYAATPNAVQRALAEAAIDAGASLVVGHHPHVPQPVERYRDGVIAYSLGNLVFDQLPGKNRDQSALLRVVMNGSGVESLTLLPYKIEDYGQPNLLTNQAAKDEVWKAFKLPGGKL